MKRCVVSAERIILLLCAVLGVLPARAGNTPQKALYTKAENRTVIGWYGDVNSPQVNIDGSIRIWGKQGDTTIGFSIFNATQPQSVKFCLEENYLPHVITEFKRDGCTVQIRHFCDKITIDGNDYIADYARVAIRNDGSAAKTIAPGAHQSFLPLHNDNNTVPPGGTSYHDYVVCVDRLCPPGQELESTNAPAWPSDAKVVAAQTYQQAQAHMKEFWKGKLDRCMKMTKFPNTDARHVFNKLRVGYITNAILMDHKSDVSSSPRFGYTWMSGQEKYDVQIHHDAIDVVLNHLMMGDIPVTELEKRRVLKSLFYNSAKPHESVYNDYPASQPFHAALCAMLMGDKAWVRDRLPALGKTAHACAEYRTGRYNTLNKSRSIDGIGY